MSSTDSSGIKNTPEMERSKGYPDYCKTITFTDNNGILRELIFPKALDLDRPKRARTTFSRDQLEHLEAEFNLNQYLVGRERSQLALDLGLSETQVKVWFQNRRTKHKRDKERQEEKRSVEAETLATKSLLQILQPTQEPPPCSAAPVVHGQLVMPPAAARLASVAPPRTGTMLAAEMCCPGMSHPAAAAVAARHAHPMNVDYAVARASSVGQEVDRYFACQPRYAPVPHVPLSAAVTRWPVYPYMSHGMT